MRSWRSLLALLALLGFVFAVTSWIVEGVTPSWVVFPALLALGLFRMRKGGSSGVVLLGASALLFLLVHIPFVVEALSTDCVNPTDSDRPCHRAWWLVSLGAFPLVLVLTSGFAHREAGGEWSIGRHRR